MQLNTDKEHVLDVSSFNAAGERLDLFLSRHGPQGVSRSQIKRLIDEGHVTLNGRPTKPGTRLRDGETVRLVVQEPEPIDAIPQDIPINIVHEDQHLLVVDKPAGLSVHPGPGHPHGTLVNALLHHCKGRLAGIGGALRPGIVHRLDMDTTGLMVVAKSDLAHQRLAAAFSERLVKRRYFAIVCRSPRARLPAEGRFATFFGRHPGDRKKFTGKISGGKEAITNYVVMEEFSHHALVEATLETGRTHQVRVHFAEAGFPLLGDPVYGGRPARAMVPAGLPPLGRQALHAWHLSFLHPEDGCPMEFKVDLPDDMERVLNHLRNPAVQADEWSAQGWRVGRGRGERVE